MSLDYKVYHGLCPDFKCQNKVFFAAHKDEIECPNCGQLHSQRDLISVAEVTDEKEAVAQVLKSIVWDVKLPKKNTDTVKVNGLSNYHCKLLSPLLTKYGMDKEGSPKLLKDLGHGETANCGRILCKRSFSISPGHIDVTGYGKDQSGSEDYLKCLLASVNEDTEVLVPIHADGDGHCLVHALSRATTGREIFWHALSQNLMNHLKDNQRRYEKHFREFIDEDDWPLIIDEADPDYVSPDGILMGLRNIHIFALANVLKRPIILLDVLENVESVADYTGIFLPVFEDWVDCKDHPPLCIAWSGAAHNHFIPLVGVEGRVRPKIPAQYVPKVWGVDGTRAKVYLKYNGDGSVTIPGGQQLKEGYVQRLVQAIEKVFLEQHGVSAGLVSDMQLYIFQRVGIGGLRPEIAISKTREALEKQSLFRCLWCNTLTRLNIDEESLTKGGFYHNVMIESHGTPDPAKIYSFPIEELQCSYDPERDRLVPYKFPCSWCKNQEMRLVDKTGKFVYQNGDPTRTPAQLTSSCCGFKHFWDGKEYENIPKIVALNITLGGKSIQEQIAWFYGDSDPAANSDINVVSREVATKYFGEDDDGLTAQTAKVKSALKSTLRDMDLSYEESFSRPKDAIDKTKTSKQKPKEKSSVQNETPHCSSKRSLLKREANGAMKPPSPILQRQSEDQNVTSKKSEEKIIPTKKLINQSNIKVRFATSDGQGKTIEIPADMDYSSLTARVSEDFKIPESMLVLKTGFPPKLLNPSPAGQKLALRHGDKVTVEIHTEKRKTESQVTSSVLDEAHKQSSQPPETSKLREALADILPPTGANVDVPRSIPNLSNLDISLQAVSKMAQITKRSVWEYAIRHPELFRREGVFYNLFCRDIGLVHGKHCKFSLLPGRLFWYNGEVGYDRVELCLEPTGHFPITPEITKIVDKFGNVDGLRKENGPAMTPQSTTDPDPDQEISEDVAIPVEDAAVGRTESPQIDIRIESKYSGPGFVIIGNEPATVSPDEAKQSREILIEKLGSNKQ